MNLHERPETTATLFHGFVTSSPQMLDFFELARRVARTDAAVLIRGETGTGKELAARALHEMSPRRQHPFRALNCATLTPELLASELFGHVKGAFTGAIQNRKGLFELADGGTLFLDEIAEIPFDIQARLLRVLQEQSFIPVGGSEPVRVNVRVLSATHRSLRALVERHQFRADLMYRIRVVPMFLPPLHEREGDVLTLAWHFIDAFNAQSAWRKIRAIEQETLDLLMSYDWPGNVRELRNVVEYAFAVGEGPNWSAGELPPELRGEGPMPDAMDHDEEQERSGQGVASGEGVTAAALEREQLIEALRQAHGRRAEVARLLNISRTTLWRKLKEHGLT